MFFTFIFLIFTFLQSFSLPYHFISPLLLQPFFFLYLFISSLLLLHFSLPHFFISPIPSILISFFLFPFIFLYFCLFLFTPSYYKFITISSILCIVFPHKIKKVLSLNFLVDFLFFLYLCFRLILFYLPTTLYINIILPLSLHLFLFLSLLIHTLLL